MKQICKQQNTILYSPVVAKEHGVFTALYLATLLYLVSTNKYKPRIPYNRSNIQTLLGLLPEAQKRIERQLEGLNVIKIGKVGRKQVLEINKDELLKIL
jgi:hypothetical protein